MADDKVLNPNTILTIISIAWLPLAAVIGWVVRVVRLYSALESRVQVLEAFEIRRREDTAQLNQHFDRLMTLLTHPNGRRTS